MHHVTFLGRFCGCGQSAKFGQYPHEACGAQPLNLRLDSCNLELVRGRRIVGVAEEKFRNIEERIAALWERLVLHNGQKLTTERE